MQHRHTTTNKPSLPLTAAVLISKDRAAKKTGSRVSYVRQIQVLRTVSNYTFTCSTYFQCWSVSFSYYRLTNRSPSYFVADSRTSTDIYVNAKVAENTTYMCDSVMSPSQGSRRHVMALQESNSRYDIQLISLWWRSTNKIRRVGKASKTHCTLLCVQSPYKCYCPQQTTLNTGLQSSVRMMTIQ